MTISLYLGGWLLEVENLRTCSLRTREDESAINSTYDSGKRPTSLSEQYRYFLGSRLTVRSYKQQIAFKLSQKY